MSQSQKSRESNGCPPASSSKKLPFEAKQLKSLVDLMVENDLCRLELREGDTHIVLRRRHPAAASPSTALVAAPPNPTAQAPAASTPAVTANEVFIRSPMVGTFYAAADPESPPLVSVGSLVGPDTVVCVIEAMKVFNELKAEVSGQITKVLVKNATAVEFDQPLFAVTPA
jgi:acetyl-CoA carboxylase biotin carboxyl carrier protein